MTGVANIPKDTTTGTTCTRSRTCTSRADAANTTPATKSSSTATKSGIHAVSTCGANPLIPNSTTNTIVAKTVFTAASTIWANGKHSLGKCTLERSALLDSRELAPELNDEAKNCQGKMPM